MPKRKAQRLAIALTAFLDTRFAAMGRKHEDIDAAAVMRDLDAFAEELQDNTDVLRAEAALNSIRGDLARGAADRVLVGTLAESVKNLSVGISASVRPGPAPAGQREGAFTANMLLSEAMQRVVAARVKSLCADREDGAETQYCKNVRNTG